jgi:hypothetical protein
MGALMKVGLCAPDLSDAGRAQARPASIQLTTLLDADYQVPVVPLTILQPLAFEAPEVSQVRDTVPSPQRM